MTSVELGIHKNLDSMYYFSRFLVLLYIWWQIKKTDYIIYKEWF